MNGFKESSLPRSARVSSRHGGFNVQNITNLLLFSIFTVQFAALVSGAGYQYDPVKNFCRRVNHQSVLLEGRLYVEGGSESYVQLNSAGNQDYSKNLTVGQLDDVLLYNLSVAWDWRKNNVPISTIPKQPASGVNETVPNLIHAALWSGPKYTFDNQSKDVLYHFGGLVGTNQTWQGYTAPESDDLSLWRVTTQYGHNKSTIWEPVPLLDKATGQKATLTRPNSGAQLFVPELNMAFYLGGEVRKGSSLSTNDLGSGVQFLNGMLVLEFVSETGKIEDEKVYVRNLSTTALGNRGRSRGEMVYVPGVGKKGILVLIGGGLKNPASLNDDWRGDLAPMTQIAIFDVASLDNTTDEDGGKWYVQRATSPGSVPKGRTDHCLIAASADDGSSHNIYVYAGQDAAVGLDDIWALSLPSFRWISLDQGADQRQGHTCHLYKNRQMITSGGQGGLQLNQAGSCDWELKGIAVLDVSTIQWGSSFDPGKDGYYVPLNIYNVIGGDGAGNATKKEPELGWDNSELQALFSQRGNVGEGNIGGGNSTSTQSSSPSNNKTSPAKIAGIVLGVLVGFAIILGLLLIFLHRRKQKAKQEGPLAELPLATPELVRPEELDDGKNKELDRGELAGHVNHEKHELPVPSGQDYGYSDKGQGHGHDRAYELETPVHAGIGQGVGGAEGEEKGEHVIYGETAMAGEPVDEKGTRSP